MDAILWFITLILIFGVIMFTPFNTIILRYLYKNERIVPSSSTAQNNVTLYNELNGQKYAPVSVEPLDDDEFAIRVESREAPYQETVLTLIREQFKEDPINVCKTGMPYYRIIPRELINSGCGINDASNPTYSKEELQTISEDAFKEKVLLEGEIATLKANREEDVNSIIGHSKDITASKFNPR